MSSANAEHLRRELLYQARRRRHELRKIHRRIPEHLDAARRGVWNTIVREKKLALRAIVKLREMRHGDTVVPKGER